MSARLRLPLGWIASVFLLATSVSLLLPACKPGGQPGPATVRFTIRDCEYGPASDPEFSQFGADAITCTHAGKRGAILTILSVDIERYCAHRQGPCDLAFPLPKILNARGEEVGRLPDNFPGEAAVKYDIILQEFVDGWPQTIVLSGESVGVGAAPQWTPLKWDRTLGRFSESRVQE